MVFAPPVLLLDHIHLKRIISIPVFIFLAFSVKAQVAFKTIVPLSPIIVGESFQVQYTIEDAEDISDFKLPSYDNFKVIAGPNLYPGRMEVKNHIKKLQNSVYTLVALKSGRFIIPGATAIIDNKSWRSNDAVVEVISKEEAIKRYDKDQAAFTSEYFLRPGEDAYEKIRKNLFLKMMVNKKTCYVGEPVLATFKLYSRLESRSDIIKNPGFYGFTVYDMVNLDDKAMTTENVQGKLFDVHTIRKVQLYPLQAGNYIIDAMQVKNQVEFSRSAVIKKTEQEIVEGVMGDNEKIAPGDAKIFETNISTPPVAIVVKPSPEKTKPVSFNGATGAFTISAKILNDELAKNEEGILEVVVRGKGNFIQLNAPVINWPGNIEVFEPVITDELDKAQLPLSGSRTFRYAFVSANPGRYTIPAITLSYFNPDNGRYKTVTSDSLVVSISNEEKMNKLLPDLKTVKKASDKKYWLTGSAALLLCFAIALLFFVRRKTTIQSPARVINPNVLSVHDVLTAAYLYAKADDRSFYSALNQATWKYLSHHFKLSGSEMNKRNLTVLLKEKKVDEKVIEEILEILTQCEAGMFTSADLMFNKDNLLKQTREVLLQISKTHSEYL